MTVRDLLEQLAELPEQEAINLAIERLDDWLLEGRFDLVNQALEEVDVTSASAALLLALASAAPRGARLPARGAFLARALARATELLGAERARKLFAPWQPRENQG
jgi:hypothetical protein